MKARIAALRTFFLIKSAQPVRYVKTYKRFVDYLDSVRDSSENYTEVQEHLQKLVRKLPTPILEQYKGEKLSQNQKQPSLKQSNSDLIKGPSMTFEEEVQGQIMDSSTS